MNKCARLIVFLIFLAGMASGCAAQDGSPDPVNFSEFPPQRIGHLDAQISEKLLELDLEMTRAATLLEEQAACDAKIGTLIAAYVEDYPQFARYAKVATWQQRWADHFVLQHYRGQIGCHIELPMAALLRQVPQWMSVQERDSGVPRWCGRWRDGAPSQPVDFALEGFLTYAFDGRVPKASWLVTWQTLGFLENGNSITIGANPDVTLYILERSKLWDDPENFIFHIEYDEPQSRQLLLHTLTPERISEVKKAARHGEIEQILATTPQCRSRAQLLEAGGLEP